MKLYPLGTQRSLEDSFDEVDYSGPDGSRKGLLKKYFKDNRRYNGIYSEIEGDTVVLYYFSHSPNEPTVDMSVFTAMGYGRDNLLKGLENPLYVCRDVHEFNGTGKFKRVSHEETLLSGATARKLIKMYLDPFYFKLQKREYKEYEPENF